MSPAPIKTAAPARATSFAEASPGGGGRVSRSCPLHPRTRIENAMILERKPEAGDDPVVFAVADENVEIRAWVDEPKPEPAAKCRVPATR